MCVCVGACVSTFVCVGVRWREGEREREQACVLSLLLLPLFRPSLMIEGLQAKGEILIQRSQTKTSLIQLIGNDSTYVKLFFYALE